MTSMGLATVTACLQGGNMISAIKLLQSWLEGAAPGDMERALAEGTPAQQAALVLLLRDVMARYPATVLGAPVLFYIDDRYHGLPGGGIRRATDSLAAARNPKVQLPFAYGARSQPNVNLHFLGWAPIDASFPLSMPFRPERYNTLVPTRQIYASVALFRSHPGVYELGSLDLEADWWAALFAETPGFVRLSARMLLPYPDAIEAAQVMYHTSQGTQPPRTWFLSESAAQWAQATGALFVETCRHPVVISAAPSH